MCCKHHNYLHHSSDGRDYKTVYAIFKKARSLLFSKLLYKKIKKSTYILEVKWFIDTDAHRTFLGTLFHHCLEVQNLKLTFERQHQL